MLRLVEKTAWPILTKFPKFTIELYSHFRPKYITSLVNTIPLENYGPSPHLQRTLWGLSFASPLMNAAGMFKNGEGYLLCKNQGAGAYLAGTTTYHKQKGNRKEGILMPFVPYRLSHAGSNWLGLPNASHAVVASQLESIDKDYSFPVGASISLADTPQEVISGMHAYEQAHVDYLELNESCPNVISQGNLESKLKVINKEFLQGRTCRLPVIVKLSLDTLPEHIPRLVAMLISYGMDGLNLGNTSTRYSALRERINPKERNLYDYFTTTFGGGISGLPLKEDSLLLSRLAVESARKHASSEFHVFRTGGISSSDDIIASEEAGISMNQWYTGYFEHFAQEGHRVYANIYARLNPASKCIRRE
ncbi:MAG: hypothetical protein ABIJ21_04420 [Nanoarchaeota archaeon]